MDVHGKINEPAVCVTAIRPERKLTPPRREAGLDPLQSVTHIPESGHSPLLRQCIPLAGLAARPARTSARKPHPIPIGLFGAQAIVPVAQHLAHLIQQTRRLGKIGDWVHGMTVAVCMNRITTAGLAVKPRPAACAATTDRNVGLLCRRITAYIGFIRRSTLG